MHDLESLLQDPHMVATDFFPVVDHPTEGRIRNMQVVGALVGDAGRDQSGWRRASSEHSAEILREAGFSADEIAAMVRDGVTKAAPEHIGLRSDGFRAVSQPGIDPRRGRQRSARASTTPIG